MKHLLAVIFLFLPIFLMGLEEYVFDLRENNTFSVFEEANAPLWDMGIENSPGVRPGRFIFFLPGDIKIVFDSDRGHLTPEFKDSSKVSYLALRSKGYALDEAIAVSDAFHEAFEISKEGRAEWIAPVYEGGYPISYYMRGKKMYPRISLGLYNNYDPNNKPLFLSLRITWREKLMRKLKLSPETNTIRNLTFDIPAIVESVRANRPEEPVVEEAVVEAPATEITKETVEDVEPEAPAEEVPPIVKDPEESSNLLWYLLIALVIIAILFFAVKRKGIQK